MANMREKRNGAEREAESHRVTGNATHVTSMSMSMVTRPDPSVTDSLFPHSYEAQTRAQSGSGSGAEFRIQTRT